MVAGTQELASRERGSAALAEQLGTAGTTQKTKNSYCMTRTGSPSIRLITYAEVRSETVYRLRKAWSARVGRREHEPVGVPRSALTGCPFCGEPFPCLKHGR